MIDGHRGELRERLVDDQLCECVDVFNIDTGFGHGRHVQTVTECDIRVCSFPADLFGSLAAVKFSTEYHADALDFVGNGRSHMCKYCVEYFICPDCGKVHEIFGESKVQKLAAIYGIDAFIRLPINPDSARLVDEGRVEDIDCDYVAALADTVLR